MTLLEDEDCSYHNVYLSLSFIILNFVITVAVFSIAVLSIYKFITTGSDIKLRYRFACSLTIAVFCMQSTFIVIHLSALLYCPAKRLENPFYFYSGLLFGILNPYNFCAIYGLFAVRLVNSFEDSIFEVPKRYTYFIYFSIVTQFVIILIAEAILIIVYFMNMAQSFFFPITAYLALFYIIFYVLCFIFLLRLFYIQIHTVVQYLFSNDIKKREKLLDSAVKQLACCIFAISSSLISSIVYSVTLETQILWLVHFTVANFDILLNDIFLVLQWPFFKGVYYKHCIKCDRCVRHCCKGDFDASNVDPDAQMVTISTPSIKT